MAIRDSLMVQAAGPTGLIDVEEGRVGLGALIMPHTSIVKAKSGFRPGPTSPGAVTATGTPDANVHVAPFQLLLQGGRASVPGVYLACADAIVDINILSPPADPTNPRNDLVIAQQSDTFYGDGTSPFEVKKITGTPAGSPADPAIPGSGDHVTLARVRVDAAVTTIVSGKITDLRTSGHAKSLVGGLYSVALGGILPVASQAERDALSGIYNGLAVWRQDLKQIEIYDGAAFRNTAGPVKIGEFILGSATPDVTFSSIPGSYRSLEIHAIARCDGAATLVNAGTQFNADTGANYDSQHVHGVNATVAAAETVAGTSMAMELTGNTATANTATAMVIKIPWYAGTTFHKELLIDQGLTSGTGSGNLYRKIWTGRWRNTAAITSIRLFPIAGNFMTGSSFALYGIG